MHFHEIFCEIWAGKEFMLRRVEAPSRTDLLRVLRKQTMENGQVIDGQNPQRQLAILLANHALKAALPDSCPFKSAESVYQPTVEDLKGK